MPDGNVIILCADEEAATSAREIGRRLGMDVVDTAAAIPPECTHLLRISSAGLALEAAAAEKSSSPTQVDFHDPALLHRLKTSGKNRGLGQALGLKRYPNPVVLDATAGLGRDALLLASLGCKVLMLERSPVVHALLEDGLRRAAEADTQISPLVQEMRLYRADARDWLNEAGQGMHSPPDCIYLDPMFPPRDKSAMVKKDIRLLQTLLGPAGDFEELLQLARTAARHRVVVKRPGRKPDASLPEPSFVVPGKTAHYMVYVNSSFSSTR